MHRIGCPSCSPPEQFWVLTAPAALLVWLLLTAIRRFPPARTLNRLLSRCSCLNE